MKVREQKEILNFSQGLRFLINLFAFDALAISIQSSNVVLMLAGRPARIAARAQRMRRYMRVLRNQHREKQGKK